MPHILLAYAKTRTGILTLTSIGTLLIRTGSSMLLTRLLAPTEFGIVGIITSVFFTVEMVTDIGIQDFLIRHHRTDDRHFRNVVWTIHAKRGFALFLLIALASPLIAGAFGKPVLTLPLAVASTMFAINGVVSLSIMTALRRDKSRELSWLEFGLQIFQTLACLLLAFWLRNAWSIIIALVLQSSLKTFLSYYLFADSSQRPARDAEISKEFLKFSSFIMVSSSLTMVIGQIDKLVLGRVFTLAEFGLYAIALTIASAPVGFGEAFVGRIAFPVYAQTWREAPSDLASVYYRVRRMASLLYAFGCGGLAGSAPLIIALLYDPRYAPAAAFVSLLMIGTMLRMPNVSCTQLLIAVGDVRKTVHLTIVRLVWLLTTMPLGFSLLGPIGVVAAVGSMEVPAMLYCWLNLQRLKILKVWEELLFLAAGAFGASIGWFGGNQLLHLFPHL